MTSVPMARSAMSKSSSPRYTTARCASPAPKTGRICGFTLVWRIGGCAYLLELAVARRDQGMRLRCRLLDAAEGWAREAGLAEITLATFRDVAWNTPLCERLGIRNFERAERRADLAAIQAEEADSGFAVKPRVAMRKVLSAGS